MDQVVDEFRKHCSGICHIPWNEAWVRSAVNIDLDELRPGIGDLRRLIDTMVPPGIGSSH
jgi:hypothetical protein